MKKLTLFTLLLLFLFTVSFSQNTRTENVIIVTLDGFRWQELFTGADSALLFNKAYTPDSSHVKAYWNANPTVRREALMPFFWKEIGRKGQIYGNRIYHNEVNCANPYWFSYPGYSEMFTGIVDRKMASNRKVINPNTNVLEFINAQDGYQGKVAAFSTWDVIPYVLRAPVNGIYTNTEDDITCIEHLSQNDPDRDEPLLDFPSGRRCDESTFHIAFEFLKINRPKLMFLGLDGTDDHSHGGRYGQYLAYASKADQMINLIWTWVQANADYKDKTTLIISTDHGRGRGSKKWKTHGRWAFGSNQMWMAVLGPDTPALGEMKENSRYFQKQMARTIATFLNFDFQNSEVTTAAPVKTMFYPVSQITSR